MTGTLQLVQTRTFHDNVLISISPRISSSAWPPFGMAASASKWHSSTLRNEPISTPAGQMARARCRSLTVQFVLISKLHPVLFVHVCSLLFNSLYKLGNKSMKLYVRFHEELNELQALVRRRRTLEITTISTQFVVQNSHIPIPLHV